MTIKEYIKQGKQESNYWKSTGQSTGSIMAGASADAVENSKKSFGSVLKNWWNSAMNTTTTIVKDFGNEPAYNDATQIAEVSDFVAQMAIMKRFRLGNEFGSDSHNDVFFAGFEDPTHLTFKIEFGEFGASITDNETLAAIQRNSFNTNTYYMSYDDMPMGLLDLNYSDIIGYGRSATSNNVFNEQNTYNAVNYLINRNEDRRAQYLRDFIDGLYTLQRDFPYVFQKVTGLTKLLDVDTGRGQRLKDATIQLTCLADGIDQKIHTLFTLYRKACWDEQYQRWILPDIMRYFKMIIYVFDNRCLHMGNGEFSPDQDVFPIFAFECMPCEIMLKSLYENEFTQDYSSIKSNEITIDISVKNVKTYMSNNLFQRVKYIKDIITRDDHYAVNDARETFQFGQSVDWRFRWMQRMFMMPDEYNAYYNYNGQDSSVSTGITHYFADRNDWNGFPLHYAEIEQPDNSWHYATVKDHAYVISSFKDLWKTLGDILTSNTTLIRDSRVSDRDFFVNDMNRIDPETYEYYCHHHYAEIDIMGVRRDTIERVRHLWRKLRHTKMIIDKSKMKKIKDPSLVIDTSHPESVMEELDINEYVYNGKLDISLYSAELPKMKFVDTSLNLLKPDMSMTEMLEALEMVMPDFVDMIQNLDKPEAEMTQMTEGEKLPEIVMTEMLLNLDKLQQNMEEMVLNLDKPDMNMTDMIVDLKKTIQSMLQMLVDLDKPDMNMLEMLPDLQHMKMDLYQMILNLEKARQNLQRMQLNLIKPEQDLVAMNVDLSKDMMNLAEMILDLRKPLMEMLQALLNLDKPEMDLQELLLNLEKANQNLQKMIENLDKEQQNMIEGIIDTEKTDMDMIHTIDNLAKPEMNMVDNIVDISKDEQNLIKPVVDVSHNEISMIDGIVDKDKISIDFIEGISDTSVSEMNMNEIVSDIRNSSMNMNEMNITDISSNMNMTEMNVDIYNSSMNMIDAVIDTDITHNNMITSDLDIDKPKHNYIDGIIDKDAADMNMLQDIRDISNSSLNMLQMNNDNDKMSMDMLQMNIEVSTNNMKLNYIDENLEHSEMDMNEMLHNEENSSIIFQNMDIDKTHNNVNFIEPDINNEHIGMTMVGTEDNKEHVDIELINTQDDKSHSNMNMNEMKVDTTKTVIERKDMQNMVENLEHNDEMKTVEIVESGVADEYKMPEMIETVVDSKMSDIEMVSPEEQSEMKFANVVENDIADEMKMNEMVDGEEIKNVPMNEIEANIKKEDMIMIDMSEQEDIAEMKTFNNIEHTDATEMKLDNVELSGEGSGFMLLNEMNDADTALDKAQIQQNIKSSMNNVKIENNNNGVGEMLMNRIETLVSLDLDSIKDAPMEQLAKLVGMMEDTISDARKQMKMNEIIEHKSKTGTVMEFPKMQTAERSPFVGKPMVNIDDEAIERAKTGTERMKARTNMIKNLNK